MSIHLYVHNRGECGILRIECGALHDLARACSERRNKALSGISVLARSYRGLLNANSHEKCSMAIKNVARCIGTDWISAQKRLPCDASAGRAC